jgi:hypothetical protein
MMCKSSWHFMLFFMLSDVQPNQYSVTQRCSSVTFFKNTKYPRVLVASATLLAPTIYRSCTSRVTRQQNKQNHGPGSADLVLFEPCPPPSAAPASPSSISRSRSQPHPPKSAPFRASAAHFLSFYRHKYFRSGREKETSPE